MRDDLRARQVLNFQSNTFVIHVEDVIDNDVPDESPSDRIVQGTLTNQCGQESPNNALKNL